jgi:rhodanese-related sulfurtransferase
MEFKRTRRRPVKQTAVVEVEVGQIDREELRAKIDRGDDFVLVDALSPMSFALSHLPGAVNLTPRWVEERAAWRIPDRDTEVVVYCESAECDSSTIVAKLLLAKGYWNVRHYAGGKRDWTEAGLPLEGSRA